MQIIYDLSIEEYHANPAMSCSKLKELAISPANYQYKMANREHKKAFDIGNAVHLFVLEASKADEKVAVSPELNMRTNQGKADYAAFCEANKNKLILNQDDYNECLAMAASVKASPHFSYIEHGLPEVSLFAEIEGVPVRARPDFITDKGMLVDLKTTKNASKDAFARDFHGLKYYMQAAFYMDIYELCFNQTAKGFVFIPVEKTAPFSVGQAVAMHPHNAYLEQGRQEYKRLLAVYKECVETNNWYGYFKDELDAAYEIEMPSWFERQINNLLQNSIAALIN